MSSLPGSGHCLHSGASAVLAFDSRYQRVPPLLQTLGDYPGVRCVEYHSSAVDLRNYRSLDITEQKLVERAVDKRKAEFGDSRWCAHRAMRQLVPDEPILRGDRGLPIFPPGVVGSMTHTTGYRAAVIGRSQRYRSLGVDAEPLGVLPEGVFSTITDASEREGLRRLAWQLGPDHPTAGKLGVILFSAKEAVYKTWFPLERRFLDFDQAKVELRGDGSFIARLVAPSDTISLIRGRWSVRNGYALTVAAIGS